METRSIYIKGGSYLRGFIDNLNATEKMTAEIAENKVSVMDFHLDAHPVSNARFVRFLNVRRTILTGKNMLLIYLGAADCRIYRKGLKFYVAPGYEEFPVTYVTWYGADTYARWAGKRLPLEIEWEYVAQKVKIGPTRTYEKVNQPAADPTGFYHLIGNVWEWCSDWYNFKDPFRANFENPDGLVITKQKVLKGGSWDSAINDLNAAARTFCDPRLSSNNIGFRCAKS